MREQLQRQFAPELSALPAEEALPIVAAADVLASFEVLELLRLDQLLSTADAADVIRMSLDRLLPKGK
jgi:hypothetical protein